MEWKKKIQFVCGILKVVTNAYYADCARIINNKKKNRLKIIKNEEENLMLNEKMNKIKKGFD